MAQEMATAKASPAEQPTTKTVDQPRNGIAEWTVTILLLLFGTTTLVQAFVIPTGSMEDTLLIGDHLLVDKLAYSPAGAASQYLLPYEEPKHGDIIVFRYPADITQTFVKRVIGAPGDHLKMVNQNLYRNGVLLNEPYVYHKSGFVDSSRDNFPNENAPVSDTPRDPLLRDMLERHVTNGEIVVPAGHFFAMGDNRDNSLDSRYWGFVPRDNIIGKPLIIYWSYDAPTEELAGSSANSMIKHIVDLGEHFFTRTRWNRTLRVIRGYSDADMAKAPPAAPKAVLPAMN